MSATPNTGQIVRFDDGYARMRAKLAALEPRIRALIGARLDPAKFVLIALHQIRRRPDLILQCDPLSVLGAILKSAEFGLYPDDVRNYAALVPFKSECQLIVQYQGYIELFRRTKHAADNAVEARVVYAKDQFDFAHGDRPETNYLRHKPSLDQDVGEGAHYYCLLRFKDGGSTFEVISKAQAEAWRDKYTKLRGEDRPWWTSFDSMALKTVVRRTMKFAPTDPGLQEAIALDERAEVGVEQHLEMLLEDEPGIIEAPPGSTTPARESKLSKLMNIKKQEAATKAEGLKDEAPGVKGTSTSEIPPTAGPIANHSTPSPPQPAPNGEVSKNPGNPGPAKSDLWCAHGVPTIQFCQACSNELDQQEKGPA